MTFPVFCVVADFPTKKPIENHIIALNMATSLSLIVGNFPIFLGLGQS
jgi:hypothetical protein